MTLSAKAREALEDARALLHAEAEAVEASNTIDGEWNLSDPMTRDGYDHYRRLVLAAVALRRVMEGRL